MHRSLVEKPFSPPLPSRRHLAAWTAAGLFLMGGATQLSAQEATTKPLPENAGLAQLMTPEEFKAAGLKKLSPKELENLENWLRGYRAQAEKVAVEKAVPPPSRDKVSNQEIIQSRINGMFKGLTGRTRVVLENGQIWQQSNDSDKFRVELDHPAVVLVKSFFGYQMVVVGYSRPFYVKQIIP